MKLIKLSLFLVLALGLSCNNESRRQINAKVLAFDSLYNKMDSIELPCYFYLDSLRQGSKRNARELSEDMLPPPISRIGLDEETLIDLLDEKYVNQVNSVYFPLNLVGSIKHFKDFYVLIYNIQFCHSDQIELLTLNKKTLKKISRLILYSEDYGNHLVQSVLNKDYSINIEYIMAIDDLIKYGFHNVNHNYRGIIHYNEKYVITKAGEIVLKHKDSKEQRCLGKFEKCEYIFPVENPNKNKEK